MFHHVSWDTHRRMQLMGGEEDPDIAFFDWDSPEEPRFFSLNIEGTPPPNLVFNIV